MCDESIYYSMRDHVLCLTLSYYIIMITKRLFAFLFYSMKLWLQWIIIDNTLEETLFMIIKVN